MLETVTQIGGKHKEIHRQPSPDVSSDTHIGALAQEWLDICRRYIHPLLYTSPVEINRGTESTGCRRVTNFLNIGMPRLHNEKYHS